MTGDRVLSNAGIPQPFCTTNHFILQRTEEIHAMAVTDCQISKKQSSKHVEGGVAQWRNPLTLQLDQSGGVGSRRGRASPPERHDKVSRTR